MQERTIEFYDSLDNAFEGIKLVPIILSKTKKANTRSKVSWSMKLNKGS